MRDTYMFSLSYYDKDGIAIRVDHCISGAQVRESAFDLLGYDALKLVRELSEARRESKAGGA